MQKFYHFKKISDTEKKRKSLFFVFILILGLFIGLLRYLWLSGTLNIWLFKSEKNIIHEIYWIDIYQNYPKIEGLNYEFQIDDPHQFEVGKVIRVIGILNHSSAKNFFDKKELIIKEIQVRSLNLFSVRDLWLALSGKLSLLQISLRTSFYNSLSKIINLKNAELYATMLWGTRFYNQDKEFKDIMRLSGLSHVLSVSGFHLGIIFDTFSYLFLLIFQVGRSQVSRLVKIILLILFLGSYTLVVGSTPSVLRAYFMLIFKLINREFFYSITHPVFILFSVIFLMLIYNPFYLGSVGWLLSVLATFAIIIRPKINLVGYPKIIVWLLENLFLTFFIQVFLLPIFWLVFSEIQLSSFISNLVVMPFVPILLFIAIVFWILDIISEISWCISIFFYIYGLIFNVINNFLLQIVQFISTLNLPREIPEWTFHWIWIVFYYLIILFLIFLWQRKKQLSLKKLVSLD